MATVNPEALNNDDVWYTVETKAWKVTVEQVCTKRNETFIATYWDKHTELEIDRTVIGEFETSGGATGQALSYIASLLKEE